MSDSQALLTVAEWLAGAFDNQLQAQAQPAWFVHLRLWHRPLPFRIHGNLALFAEQSNALYLDRPYRQRIIVLRSAERLQAQYLALKQADLWRGAGANPSLLANLTLDDLEPLPGCILTITRKNETFRAEPEFGAKCCFQYEGKTRQVILGFAVSKAQFSSFDRGIDPDTGQALWGALMGAYEFDKCQDFTAQLPAEERG